MRPFAAAAILLLATPAVAAQVPVIEPVYGVTAGRMGITVRVASNGCTRKSDLTVAVAKGKPRPIFLIARRHPDVCKTPGAAEIVYPWAELGLAPGQAFSLANPLIAEPAATPGAADRSGAPCRHLEVDAVLPDGTGQVRILGPGGATLDVGSPPLVASSEVTAAEAEVDRGENVVRFALAPQAAQRLAAWTGAHRGSRLAILLDGQVIRLVDVAGPIGAQGLELSGLDRGQTLSLAAGVSACGG